jgi:hypothetical protein
MKGFFIGCVVSIRWENLFRLLRILGIKILTETRHRTVIPEESFLNPSQVLESKKIPSA